MALDLSHLEKLQPSMTTVRYTFEDFMGADKPWVEVTAASHTNKPYVNDLMKMTGTGRVRQRRRDASADVLAETLANERVLFARHVVKAWGNVADASGKAVPFSPENCQQWLEALPDYMILDLSDFVHADQNFVPPVEELAKN